MTEERSPQAVSAARDSTLDPFEPLLQRVTRVAIDASQEEEQREAAELLHALGTTEALRRLGTRPRHAFARALLRDTRWESVEAGAVPRESPPRVGPERRLAEALPALLAAPQVG